MRNPRRRDPLRDYADQWLTEPSRPLPYAVRWLLALALSGLGALLVVALSEGVR